MYVGTDGKLRVTKGGADTVLNFSKIPTLTYIVGKAASYASMSFDLEINAIYLLTAQATDESVTSTQENYIDYNMARITGIEILQTSTISDTAFSRTKLKWYIVKAVSNTCTLNANGGIALNFIKLT